MVDQRARGAQVEALARQYLTGLGLSPIAVNANYRFGELDLVMRDGATIVFVEVRYRSNKAFGGGAASIDLGKRRRLVRSASAFLAEHREYANEPCRFDVIEAGGEAQTPEFHWLRDAFRADDV